jgi:hypothetical protein
MTQLGLFAEPQAGPTGWLAPIVRQVEAWARTGRRRPASAVHRYSATFRTMKRA